jgi:hypothetical protein
MSFFDAEKLVRQPPVQISVKRVLHCLVLLAVCRALMAGSRAQAGGTWTALTAGPPVGVNNCLLLSDGTVLGMNGAGQCVKLTPDLHGSYINGTWTTLATMNSSRLFFSSDVLTNGNVFVAGGEYGDANHYDAELYDALADAWSVVPGSHNFGYSDSPSELLPDGNVLESDSQSYYNFYLTAANLMTNGGPCADMNEVCWVKMSNTCIFAVGNYGGSAEHFVPALGQWITDSTSPPSGFGDGDDQNFLLPNGQVFHVGSTANTGFYTPGATVTEAGTLVNGPNLPMVGTNQLYGGESPGAMLSTGNILLDLAPNGGGANGGGPCYFYEYNYLSNTFTLQSAPGGGSSYGSSPFVNSMLDLPDGSVLLVGGQNSGSLYIYTPAGPPWPAGQPVIHSLTENADGTYHLTGQGFNGLSEGAMFGDDEQMACNYPLVRLTNNTSGNVYYARTYNWTSTTVQNTNVVATELALPQNLPPGNYSLVVTAVGNPSVAQAFKYAPPPAPTGLMAASGSNALVNLQWNASQDATAYNVKRALSQSGYFATVATVSSTNYADTGLVNEMEYYYKVAAVGSGGPSADSSAVSATPSGPPPIPTDVTAVPDTFERIDLAWRASYDATNYNIKRSTTHGGPYTNVASSVNIFFTDAGLVSGTTYYYVVSAVSSEGESGNSMEASAAAQAIGNFGFETPSIGAGNYQYALPGAGWTFEGYPGSGSGIIANSSGFSNPNAPEGVQAAFLQGHGVISQVLSGFTPGTTYTITYYAAQRPGNSQSWNVMIDSSVIKSNSPGGTSYATYTATFMATAVTHTLFFIGTDLAGGDNTVFIDDVRISPPLASMIALPVLTQNTLPATAAMVVGDTVSFTAAYSNAPAANYQWQFIGAGAITDIPGATNSTLTLTNLQLGSSGFYRLEAVNATNSQGAVYSATSPLTVSNVPAAVTNVITSYAAQTGYGSVLTNFAPTWTVAPGSLIAGQSPSSVGSGNFNMNGTGGVAVLTDGAAGSFNFWPGTGSSITEATCGSGAGQSVTYTLPGSPDGYILTNITVYGGWGDSGRDQQAYTVYYSTVAAPATFVWLSTVNYLPLNPAAVQCATRATLTPARGWLATNVAAVMFDFTTPAGENSYEGYSEIDLYGTSIAPVVTMNTLPVTAVDVVGSQVTFNAAIIGLDVVYQWQKISGGVTNSIPGANSTTLTLANLQLTDTAAYQLQASNAYGVAVSAPSSLTVNSIPAAVNNVIAELAAQTGLGPSDTIGTMFTPTWAVTTNPSLIAGQPPNTSIGNFSEEISGRSVNSLTAGGSLALALVNGTDGLTTSTNYVTCGNEFGAGSSVTYNLAGSAYGFNLTNITVYGGWGDAGRDQQAYTVYYSMVDSPSTYKSLGAVNYYPSNPGNVQSATRVTLIPANGVLATNVADVMLDFTSPASENGYCGYAQIQIFGAPSVPPAVPTSVSADLAGTGGLVMNIGGMVVGRNYEVQSTTNLISTVWVVETNFVAQAGSTAITNDTAGSAQKFYRIAGY